MKYRGKWTETNIPCPCGVSSDAFSIDDSGNGFCFRGNCKAPFYSKEKLEKRGLDKTDSDGYNILIAPEEKEYIYTNSNTSTSNTNRIYLKNNVGENTIETEDVNNEVKFDYYGHRGISKKTMEFYDVQTKFVNNEPIECGFILPNKSVQIKKLDRSIIKGRYRVEGEYGSAGLFGKDRFDPGSKESITITEGYHDALAVYDMIPNTAATSVKSSSTAKSDCVKDWEYINSFQKIYLCLDNDESGYKATREIANLFDFNKVYHVKLQKHKDANEYLENQEVQDFVSTWKAARRFAPDNIISGFSEIAQALKKDTESQIGTYPFKALNGMTYGLHEGEVVVVKAMEGVGKTEFFRAIEHHLLKTTKFNIGIIHLEEDNGTTVKAIAGYELHQPAVLPDCGLSDEDILAAYKKAVKDDEGRIHIYSSFDQEDEQQLLDNIRFLVAAAGCKFVFLDHITWLATGREDEDERKKLDRLSQKLKLLAKELRFCLIMISHVNDDGKTRGSRNISKVANTLISLDRDKTSYDTIIRNTTMFMLEKVRLGGHTGPAGSAIMDSMTGRLEDNNEPVS